MKKSYRTISLPDELYQQLENLIKSTGFRSPTEYILYLLRQALGEIEKEKERLNQALQKEKTKTQIEKIKTRLKRLGYFV